MRKIITGIDIGSDSIKIIVGEFVKDKLHILGVSSLESDGIKNGLIVNAGELIIKLKESFKNIEDSLGVHIKQVIASVPENLANFYVGEGYVEIISEDKIITGQDIIDVLKASISKKIPETEEIITVTPVEFLVNETDLVKDPKGLSGENLGVKTILVTTPKKNAYTIASVLNQIGIDVVDITLGSIADYYSFKNELTDTSVGAVVNIGYAKTTVSIFNKGVLTNTEVIDIGGSNVDSDISFIYKVNKSDAIYLKENLSLAHKRLASASETETVITKSDDKIKINQYEISEIVMSRLEEMLNLIKKQINLLTKKEIGYIIFTGGVTESSDFSIILESVFGHNVTLGINNELGARDNKYSTVLGLLKYFNEKLKLRDKSYSMFTKEEQEELSSVGKKINISSDSLIGKIFGYFFDN